MSKARAALMWIADILDRDFAEAEAIEIFGISTKVIPKDDLLEYKSGLNREVDIIDIEQITNNE
jgi:hypothetical protein